MTKTGPVRIREEIQKNKTDDEMEALLLGLWDLELEEKMRYKEAYKDLILKCSEKRCEKGTE
ncbi:hypothetical protein [Methanorbis furvi]|uniref:Uncharacterized protein n=1 Tax=Methanorbis furvi TaxID=3028299 RepID=A0AAE4ME01_9EURY|nr:hypothetical protein [Methanocorpusculaceae archaeon Ag1]